MNVEKVTTDEINAMKKYRLNVNVVGKGKMATEPPCHRTQVAQKQNIFDLIKEFDCKCDGKTNFIKWNNSGVSATSLL